MALRLRGGEYFHASNGTKQYVVDGRPAEVIGVYRAQMSNGVSDVQAVVKALAYTLGTPGEPRDTTEETTRLVVPAAALYDDGK